MKTNSPLLQGVMNTSRFMNHLPATGEAYARDVKKFVLFCGKRHPRDCNERKRCRGVAPDDRSVLP